MLALEFIVNCQLCFILDTSFNNIRMRECNSTLSNVNLVQRQPRSILTYKLFGACGSVIQRLSPIAIDNDEVHRLWVLKSNS